jgi:hypothetical protein
MKPALLPTAALGIAISAFFLPPVLSMTGAAPMPSRPAPMLVVQSEPVSAPTFANGRTPANTSVTPVRARVVPARPGEPMTPQFTRVASNAAPAASAHD